MFDTVLYFEKEIKKLRKRALKMIDEKEDGGVSFERVKTKLKHYQRALAAIKSIVYMEDDLK